MASPKKPDDPKPTDSYDLEGGFEEDDAPPPVPMPRAPIVPASPRSKAKSKPSAEEGDRAPQVDEIWTRGAEWGPSLILMGIVGATFLVLVYVLIAWNDQWGMGFLLLLIGMATCGVLSYPILITLERPVRITPEQAAKDYFAALSHFLPHYRRMWLLLSTPARNSAEFDSFSGFKAYWKRRMAELKGGPAKTLAFDVADFKSEKSAGKSYIDGKFTVIVRRAGEDSGTPLDTIRMSIGFAKGADNMWYLDSGTLP